MGLVNFVITDAAGFATIDSKNTDTLYFVEDTRKIYKGDTEYGMKFQSVANGGWDSIDNKDTNTIYREEGTFHLRMWSGTQWINLSLPVQSTVTESTQELASNKAIRDYVESQMADLDVGALEGRVDTLETEMDAAQASITTLTGDGEGSVTKAKADAIAAAKEYTDTEVAKKADLEHTHEMADITGLDTALAGKANSATTLEGYGITDAYTQTQTDTKIAEAVAAAPHLKRTIVEQLPEVEEADENTIYMVGTGAGSEDSAYEEYMLINGAFERIGTSDVDLTNYATKEYADQAEADAISTAANDATSKASTAESNAKTYADGLIDALDKTDSAVEGQYVSAVSQENGVITVERATLPTAPEITTGTTNGTIKVGAKEVAVAGLKSAAYTDATDYATAAQGAKADTAVQEVAEGTTNGTILVDGTAVSVHGLGTAAYTSADDYATTIQMQQVITALTWQEV